MWDMGYNRCPTEESCSNRQHPEVSWKPDTTWTTWEFRCNGACPAKDNPFFEKCSDKCWNMNSHISISNYDAPIFYEGERNVDIDCGVEQCFKFMMEVVEGSQTGRSGTFPLFQGGTLHIGAQENALRYSEIDGQHFQRVEVDIYGVGALGQSEIKASTDNTDFPNLFVHIHDAAVDMKSLWQCLHESFDRDRPRSYFSDTGRSACNWGDVGPVSVIFWVQSEDQLEFICDSNSGIQSFYYGLFIMDGTDGMVITEEGTPGSKFFRLNSELSDARSAARESTWQYQWNDYLALVTWRQFNPSQCGTLNPTTGSPSVSPTTSSPTTDQPSTSSPSTKVVEETEPTNTTGPWITDDPLVPAGGAKGSSKSWGTLQTALVIGGVLAGVALLVGIGYLVYRGSQGGGSNAPVRVAVPVDQDKGLDVDVEQGMGGSKHPDNQIKMADDGPVTQDRNL